MCGGISKEDTQYKVSFIFRRFKNKVQTHKLEANLPIATKRKTKYALPHNRLTECQELHR